MPVTNAVLKPFIYAMGMKWKGYTAAKVLSDLGHECGGKLKLMALVKPGNRGPPSQ